MTPNELKILRIVKEYPESTRKEIAIKMEISDEYAAYLLGRLHRASYLRRIVPASGVKKWKIGVKGLEALRAHLYVRRGKQRQIAEHSLRVIQRADEKIEEISKEIEGEKKKEQPKVIERL